MWASYLQASNSIHRLLTTLGFTKFTKMPPIDFCLLKIYKTAGLAAPFQESQGKLGNPVHWEELQGKMLKNSRLQEGGAIRA